MGKKITEMGYEATAVVCGKFVDLDNVMGWEEMADYYGYDNDVEDNEAMEEAFNGAGYTFIGWVCALKALEEEAGFMGGYLVKQEETGKLYYVHDIWDEARGNGKCKAYRFNTFTEGCWDYKGIEEAYAKYVAQQ